MAIVERGGDFLASFKASASLSVIAATVYCSASGTVAAITTLTQYPIGVVHDKSKGGAGTSVLINLFKPTRRAKAGGTVTAATKVRLNTGTATWIDLAGGTNTAIGPYAIAITGATTANALFEMYPDVSPALSLA